MGVCASDHTSTRVIVSIERCEPCTRRGQRKHRPANSSSVLDTLCTSTRTVFGYASSSLGVSEGKEPGLGLLLFGPLTAKGYGLGSLCFLLLKRCCRLQCLAMTFSTTSSNECWKCLWHRGHAVGFQKQVIERKLADGLLQVLATSLSFKDERCCRNICCDMGLPGLNGQCSGQ